jgi:hypothetical protein
MGVTMAGAGRHTRSVRISLMWARDDLYWDEVGGPLVARLTRDDGRWTDVFDATRVRSAAGAPPVEVALVALVAEALAPADA